MLTVLVWDQTWASGLVVRPANVCVCVCSLQVDEGGGEVECSATDGITFTKDGNFHCSNSKDDDDSTTEQTQVNNNNDNNKYISESRPRYKPDLVLG